MYESFYDLKTRPFLTVPNPDFLFWSENHSLAFTMLRYGLLTRAPITVISGEIGSGKTTLLRQLMREIPADLVVGLCSNVQAGRGELLEWVMMALDQPVSGEPYVTLFRRFQEFVIDCYAQGKRVVLVFDEAQNLGAETLEEVRMLSNINTDGDELLQIVLVGQPQLRDLLNKPEMVQFAQRISADFHLEALQRDEVEAYIEQRLKVAGASWRIFPKETCALIHKATRGVPRLINVLADLCLVYGFAAESKIVHEGILREFLSGARRRGIYEQFAPLDDAPALVGSVRKTAGD